MLCYVVLQFLECTIFTVLHYIGDDDPHLLAHFYSKDAPENADGPADF